MIIGGLYTPTHGSRCGSLLVDDDWRPGGSMPGYGMMESGHIALQDHGNELRFRNLRILVLPD